MNLIINLHLLKTKMSCQNTEIIFPEGTMLGFKLEIMQQTAKTLSSKDIDSSKLFKYGKITGPRKMSNLIRKQPIILSM